jgi:Rrf2 family nitric oxide-sensitive transcriptional repressor
MAECFDRDSNTCSYAPSCELKSVLGAATAAYLAVLDKVTLQDLIVRDPSKKSKKNPTKTIQFIDPS